MSLVLLACSLVLAAQAPDARDAAYAEVMAVKAGLDPKLEELRSLRGLEADTPDLELGGLVDRRTQVDVGIYKLMAEYYAKQKAFSAVNRQYLFMSAARMTETGKQAKAVKDPGGAFGLTSGLSNMLESGEMEKGLSEYITRVQNEMLREEELLKKMVVRLTEARQRRDFQRSMAVVGAVVASVFLLALAVRSRLSRKERVAPAVLLSREPAPAALPAPSGIGPYRVPRAGMDALRRAAGSSHPNLCSSRVLEEGADSVLAIDDPGRPLREALDPGRKDPGWCLTVLCRAALGLDSAHSQGMVHGGLDLEAIRLYEDGSVRVAGLGFRAALLAAGAKPPDAQAYLAPEQGSGLDRPESDVFALGVILYEMAAGALPYVGPNFAVQKRERAYRPASALSPGWPKGLDAIVAKALDPDPEKRFRSCREFIAALEALRPQGR